ncbi:MAG: prepilin-type N-terminal cleavage/methylation domain-containing protein [Pseudomonadota bacterium]|nr:prepilin-type N-terminal cleavage/methylation domain-containing protein [Pseudomonadota bacterium]
MINRSSFLPSRRLRGFTLVELMITVVVLAIIVGVALPAYTQQMHKARRSEARNALLDLAGREERWLSVANSYSQNTADVGYTGAWPVTTTNGYYQVTVAAPDPAALNPANPSYIITATAVGAQATDTACATFSVNQLGQQVASTSAPAVNTATCWGP